MSESSDVRRTLPRWGYGTESFGSAARVKGPRMMIGLICIESMMGDQDGATLDHRFPLALPRTVVVMGFLVNGLMMVAGLSS